MSEARLPESTRRPLGKLHVRVSPVGFGCYRVDDRVPRHREALRLALLSGVNLVDTSTNYGDGHSEILVGKVLKELAASGEVTRERASSSSRRRGTSRGRTCARRTSGGSWATPGGR